MVAMMTKACEHGTGSSHMIVRAGPVVTVAVSALVNYEFFVCCNSTILHPVFENGQRHPSSPFQLIYPCDRIDLPWIVSSTFSHRRADPPLACVAITFA